MGCAEFFDEHSPQTKVIAVDTVGSVTFGHEAGPRHIPGVGMSRKPELVDREFLDDVLMIPEHETVLMCREVRRTTGLVVGGSTGTVLCGVERYANRVRPGDRGGDLAGLRRPVTRIPSTTTTGCSSAFRCLRMSLVRMVRHSRVEQQRSMKLTACCEGSEFAVIALGAPTLGGEKD